MTSGPRFTNAPVRYASIAGLLALLVLCGCGRDREFVLSGRTMGTTYQVKVVAGPRFRVDHLQARINRRLEQINASMSTYRPDSELSRFNSLDRPGDSLTVSDDFFRVMEIAARLHRLTGGAWDGTVHPLVERWGFGAAGKAEKLPDPQEVETLRRRVGFRHLSLGAERTLTKLHPAVTLDLGSVAKGFGVDEVAAVVESSKVRGYLVEIGGEVRAAGLRTDGQPWRVGVNTPRTDASARQVHTALPLSGRALATSGDYRNFFQVGGHRYSHIIDPRSGYPAQNAAASVSVLASTCALADGLATALMVLGPTEGLKLVEGLEDVECLFILRDGAGNLTNLGSSGFPLPAGGASFSR